MKPNGQYKVVMLCHDDNISAEPYRDEVQNTFDSLEGAKKAIAQCVADELESLNDGKCGDIEFVANFKSAEHAAVIECRQSASGNDTEQRRDTRTVTEYDIYTAGDVEFLTSPMYAEEMFDACPLCDQLIERNYFREQYLKDNYCECPFCGAHITKFPEPVKIGKTIEEYFQDLQTKQP